MRGARMKRKSASLRRDDRDDEMHISRFRSRAYNCIYALDRKR